VGLEIAEDIAGLLESGDVATWIATASRECVPQTTRATGARVQRSPGKLWIYLPAEQSQRALANAREGAQLAATYVRIHDYRAVQVKGTIVRTWPCSDDERRWPEMYMERFIEANVRVGMERAAIEKLTYWPSVVVEIDVQDLYSQTPGQNAGSKL
jgi:hypothetical protein